MEQRLSRLLGAAPLELERGAGRVVIDPECLRHRLAPQRRSPTIGFRAAGTARGRPAGADRVGDHRPEDLVM